MFSGDNKIKREFLGVCHLLDVGNIFFVGDAGTSFITD